LRFYSKQWRHRHGADMVALMLDAEDHGEEPLSGNGRRSLMWSGLRERFASRPYVTLWIALTVAGLALYEWALYRDIPFGVDADEHGTSGFNGPLVVAGLIGAAGLVTGLTILTVSLLHRPPFPRPVAALRRGWLGWVTLALGTAFILGTPLIVASLVIGVRHYRAAASAQMRVLAILSALALGFQLIVLLPPLNLLLLG
jgi:hypothetical protein